MFGSSQLIKGYVDSDWMLAVPSINWSEFSKYQFFVGEYFDNLNLKQKIKTRCFSQDYFLVEKRTKFSPDVNTFAQVFQYQYQYQYFHSSIFNTNTNTNTLIFWISIPIPIPIPKSIAIPIPIPIPIPNRLFHSSPQQSCAELCPQITPRHVLEWNLWSCIYFLALSELIQVLKSWTKPSVKFVKHL